MTESTVVVARIEHNSTQLPHNAELLAELEELAKDRYSELDEEFMKELNSTPLPPPLVQPEQRQNRYNRGGRDGHGSGFRGRRDHYGGNRGDFRGNGDRHRDNRDGHRDNRDGYRDSRDGYRDNRDASRDNRDSSRDNRDGYRDNSDRYRGNRGHNEGYRQQNYEYYSDKNNEGNNSCHDRRSYTEQSQGQGTNPSYHNH